MRNLCSDAFVVVGKSGKMGHFIDLVGERIHFMWKLFGGRVIRGQGRVHCHIK
jgi:hypothetical protein